jgi:hypothetical protein
MSDDSDSNIHFKELNKEEKRSKLSHLCSLNHATATIWKKGSSKKIQIEFLDFYSEQEEVLVEGKIPEDLLNQDILYSFELSGLNFFGKSKLSSQTLEKIYLNTSQTLYKSERRVNFRLLTYPHQEVYLHFPIPFEKNDQGKVINLSTGISETGLFENFLKVVRESEESNEIDGHIKIRVLDVSVTGAALLLSDYENDLLPKMNERLGEVILDFNGELIEIPDCEILYKLDFKVQGKKSVFKKAGLKFKDIDTNLDELLSGVINKTLRSIESEFEDFLK